MRPSLKKVIKGMGSPRRAVALEKRGYKVSRPSVARMMKALGVEARRTRKGIGGSIDK